MKKGLKWVIISVLGIGIVGAALEKGKDKDEETTKQIVTEGNSAHGTVTESSTEKQTEKAVNAQAVSIDEQVLLDWNGVKVTATGYSKDKIWGDGIDVLVEDDSDQTVTIGLNALIVNDYMVFDLFSCEVAAGKKANDTIHLFDNGLEAAGIETVGKVELYFHVYDGDWKKLYDSEVVEIHTSAYSSMDSGSYTGGTELYNEGGIRIIGKAVDEDSIFGKAIVFYIENNSGRNIGVTADELSINGFMMTPYFSSTVYDGKKAIDDLTLLSSELEKNNITSVDDVELKFHIYDNDSYESITDSETIKFQTK